MAKITARRNPLKQNRVINKASVQSGYHQTILSL